MILLDTHVGVWIAGDSDRIGPTARAAIEEAATVWFSAVQTVELTIKQMQGGLAEVSRDLPSILVDQGLVELPVTSEHAAAMWEFPELARHEPFDRLLLAQAHHEGATLVTADQRLLGLGLDWVLDASA